MNSVNSLILIVFVLIINTTANGPKRPLIRNIFRGKIHLESPHFAPDENALYFVDTYGQTVHRYDFETGDVTSRSIEYGLVGLIVRVKHYPRLVLVTCRSGLYLVSWDASNCDNALRQLTAVDLGMPDNRCNDGKVDDKGRLWFGTMGRATDGFLDRDLGSLYLLTEQNYKQPELKVRPVSMSNGIAWSSDNKFMFYIDSLAYSIDRFDFDLETGFIGNRTLLFSYKENNINGLPDGMTIDRDDNLWVACYDGGKVIKVNSRTGKLMDYIKMPASKVTSVMWGGYDYSTLYVTTSNLELTAQQRREQPEAGSLFAIDGTGSRGYPENQLVFANADKY